MNYKTNERLISENLRELAELVSNHIAEITGGQKMAFSLVVFNDEPDARLNYIANCDRKKVCQAFKSLVTAWEEGMPDVPAHTLN